MEPLAADQCGGDDAPDRAPDLEHLCERERVREPARVRFGEQVDRRPLDLAYTLQRVFGRAARLGDLDRVHAAPAGGCTAMVDVGETVHGCLPRDNLTALERARGGKQRSRGRSSDVADDDMQ